MKPKLPVSRLKWIFLLMAFAGLAFIALFKLNLWGRDTAVMGDKIERGIVCYDVHCFAVELAVTPETQQRGLMWREKLGESEGMLFVYDREAIRGFWMKNTLIPLDIIWLDENKKVVYLAETVQPCRSEPCSVTTPSLPAKYVLELNAGTAAAIGLQVGSQLNF